MGGRGAMRTQEARRRIAIEAARLISETGLRDYRQAKQKAAARLGIFDETSLPKNAEIEDALREYQRLFRADDQPRILRERREAAREAMRFFADFEPRLVGAVLEGTADAHSAVCLHLYTDQPDAVIALLQERRIAYDEESRRIRLDRDTARDYPTLRFSAGGTPIDITMLPYDLLRQAPLDRVSERPMRRATAAMLDALLADA
ncbi:hypothetical protein EV148_10966 [Dokdonella fugitiva]|jgi:predicted nucleotidyltransferase|uniref:Nucleotidyltransferase-like protein n=2 Tax=Dokdonella fugitiva TaxID=328517 RepID=A0A4R2I190_9GAMM|nr:hypothetical protein EV148_10966 [Dokdonella fugitiva]